MLLRFFCIKNHFSIPRKRFCNLIKPIFANDISQLNKLLQPIKKRLIAYLNNNDPHGIDNEKSTLRECSRVHDFINDKRNLIKF